MKLKIYLLTIFGIYLFLKSPVSVFAGIACTSNAQCGQAGACDYKVCTPVNGAGVSGSCSWSTNPSCTCNGGTCTSWCSGSFSCASGWDTGGCNGAANCEESTGYCSDCGNNSYTCHRHPSHNVCQGCSCVTIPGIGTQECADGSSCACSTPTPIPSLTPTPILTSTPTPTRINTPTPTSTPTPTRVPSLTPTPTTILARCIRIVPNKPLNTLKIGDEVNFGIGYTDLGLLEDVAFRIFKDGQILETRFQSTYPAIPDFLRFRFTSPGRYSFAAYIKSAGVWR